MARAADGAQPNAKIAHDVALGGAQGGEDACRVALKNVEPDECKVPWEEEVDDHDECQCRVCYLGAGAEAKRGVAMKLKIALAVTLAFMVFEFVGGYITGSIAIMTDAVHELSDSASFVIAIYSNWLTTRRSSKAYTFGYHRAETVGALVNMIIICVLSFTLVMQAVERFITPEEINGKLMFIFAAIGLGINLTLLVTLGHDHGHDHDHSHHGSHHDSPSHGPSHHGRKHRRGGSDCYSLSDDERSERHRVELAMSEARDLVAEHQMRVEASRSYGAISSLNEMSYNPSMRPMSDRSAMGRVHVCAHQLAYKRSSAAGQRPQRSSSPPGAPGDASGAISASGASGMLLLPVEPMHKKQGTSIMGSSIVSAGRAAGAKLLRSKSGKSASHSIISASTCSSRAVRRATRRARRRVGYLGDHYQPLMQHDHTRATTWREDSPPESPRNPHHSASRAAQRYSNPNRTTSSSQHYSRKGKNRGSKSGRGHRAGAVAEAALASPHGLEYLSEDAFTPDEGPDLDESHVCVVAIGGGDKCAVGVDQSPGEGSLCPRAVRSTRNASAIAEGVNNAAQAFGAALVKGSYYSVSPAPSGGPAHSRAGSVRHSKGPSYVPDALETHMEVDGPTHTSESARSPSGAVPDAPDASAASPQRAVLVKQGQERKEAAWHKVVQNPTYGGQNGMPVSPRKHVATRGTSATLDAAAQTCSPESLQNDLEGDAVANGATIALQLPLELPEAAAQQPAQARKRMSEGVSLKDIPVVRASYNGSGPQLDVDGGRSDKPVRAPAAIRSPRPRHQAPAVVPNAEDVTNELEVEVEVEARARRAERERSRGRLRRASEEPRATRGVSPAGGARAPGAARTEEVAPRRGRVAAVEAVAASDDQDLEAHVPQAGRQLAAKRPSATRESRDVQQPPANTPDGYGDLVPVPQHASRRGKPISAPPIVGIDTDASLDVDRRATWEASDGAHKSRRPRTVAATAQDGQIHYMHDLSIVREHARDDTKELQLAAVDGDSSIGLADPPSPDTAAVFDEVQDRSHRGRGDQAPTGLRLSSEHSYHQDDAADTHEYHARDPLRVPRDARAPIGIDKMARGARAYNSGKAKQSKSRERDIPGDSAPQKALKKQEKGSRKLPDQTDSSSERTRQQGAHGHHHHHDHQGLRGAIVHILADILQSIGLCVAGAVIWFTNESPTWLWVDPACTILFAASVIYSTKNLLFDTLKDLMEAAPQNIDVEELCKLLHKIDGVVGVHDLHVWGIGSGKALMTAHIDIDEAADREAINAAADAAALSVGITHSTVQLCA